MKCSIWQGKELDSRHKILANNKNQLLACYVSSGHHSSVDDLVLETCTTWFSTAAATGDATELIYKLRAAVSESDRSGEHTTVSCILVTQKETTLSIHNIGSYYSLYINGRRITGGRIQMPDWRFDLFESEDLTGPHINQKSWDIVSAPIDAKDLVVIGTKFLDNYASPADIAHLSSTGNGSTECVSKLGETLQYRADAEFRTGAVSNFPRYQGSRLIATLIASHS